MKKHALRVAAGVAAGLLLALAVPLSASAHVRIDPNQASPGGYAYVAFRVPTESATASTVKLEVDLPTAHPFTSVSYQAAPGWTAHVVSGRLPKPVIVDGDRITTAPLRVIWTADDTAAAIPPGQFSQFWLSVGVVPDVGSVMMPATQTYSDGSVVKWDERTPASGVEPAHPAPTLYIDDPAPGTAPAATTNDDGTVALILGLAGLVLGAAGLVVAVLALLRRPSAAGRAS